MASLPMLVSNLKKGPQTSGGANPPAASIAGHPESLIKHASTMSRIAQSLRFLTRHKKEPELKPKLKNKKTNKTGFTFVRNTKGQANKKVRKTGQDGWVRRGFTYFLKAKEKAVKPPDTRTPSLKVERDGFNIKVNCYVLNMVVAGLMFFFSFTTYVAHFKTVSKYSMGWAFLFFYVMCGLDFVGSCFGVLSLVPEYTFGGWSLCHWILRIWNKSHENEIKAANLGAKGPRNVIEKPPETNTKPTSENNEVPDGSNEPTKHDPVPPAEVPTSTEPQNQIISPQKEEQPGLMESRMALPGFSAQGSKREIGGYKSPFSRFGQLPSARGFGRGVGFGITPAPEPPPPSQITPEPKPLVEVKLIDKKSEAGVGAKKRTDNLKQKNTNKNTKAGPPPGFFWKTGYRPCRLCTTGITVDTKKISDRMACLSCLILHSSGLMNLFCTASHKYIDTLVSEFHLENQLCETQPDRPVCKEFNVIFTALMIFTWIPILTRTLALFTIGWHTDARRLDVLRPLDTSPESVRVSKALASGSIRQGGPSVVATKKTARKKLSNENVEIKKTKKKKQKEGHSGSSGDSSGSEESEEGEYSIQIALDELAKHGEERKTGRTEMARALQSLRDPSDSIWWTFDYVTIYARERDAYMNTMTTLGQAGLIGFWQELGKLQHSQQRKITFKSERSEKYIQNYPTPKSGADFYSVGFNVDTSPCSQWYGTSL